LDETTVWQIIDDAFAATNWILKYITKHALPVADDPDFPAFKHNILRLIAVAKTENYKIPYNPILTDKNPPPDKLPVYFGGGDPRPSTLTGETRTCRNPLIVEMALPRVCHLGLKWGDTG